MLWNSEMIEIQSKKKKIKQKRKLISKIFSILKSKKKNNIFEIILFYYYTLKCIGYSCFTIKGNLTDGKIQTTLGDIGIFIIFLIFNFVSLYQSYYSNFFVTESAILDFGNRLLLCSTLVIVTFAGCLVFIFRHKVWRITKLLYEIDNQLENLGYNVDHDKYALHMKYYTGSSIILWMICASINLHLTGFQWMRLLYLILSSGNYIIVMQVFILYLSGISERIKHMNICFKKHFLPSNKWKIKQVMNWDNKYFISRFGTLHNTINELTDLINFCYSFQIMLCFALFFVYTILTTFAAFRLLTSDNNSGSTNEAIYSFCWNALYFKFAIEVMALGSSITTDGKYTTVLIHQAINIEKDSIAIERLFSFSLQVGYNIPVISCGLFTFDWSLLFSICAASTTYLVILVQFDNSIKSN